MYDLILNLKRVVEGFSNFSIDEQAIKHIELCIDKLIVHIKDVDYELFIQMGISVQVKLNHQQRLRLISH